MRGRDLRGVACADGLLPVCIQASCHLLATGWTCVCDDGYVGDGRLCYGTIGQVSPESSVQNLEHHQTEGHSIWLHPQELMVLPTVSDFYTWTMVS